AAVAVVEGGNNFALEQVEQGGGMALVLRALVAFGVTVDGPAVGTVVRLGPPPVEHGEVQRAVEARLHPAGPAGLERRPGDVEPHVAAGDQVAGDAEAVVLEESDVAGNVR